MLLEDDHEVILCIGRLALPPRRGRGSRDSRGRIMVVATPVLIAATVTAFSHFLPHPADKDGWRLRIHHLSVSGPYFVGESIDRKRFRVTLLNVSDEERVCDPLFVSKETGDLQLTIFQADGKFLQIIGGEVRPRDPFTEPMKLPAGHGVSLDFQFVEFGYTELRRPGAHKLELTLRLRVGGKSIAAPPVELAVIEPEPTAILTSHRVPLEGRTANLPADEQERPFVQQVKVGGRVFLIYRILAGSKWGTGYDFISRLAELTGKVEMTVEGAYGGRNPLTIKYKDANSKTGWTTLVINSINGRLWTEGEERLRLERIKKAATPVSQLESPIAPAPRPGKP
jgi:hypothetical protein